MQKENRDNYKGKGKQPHYCLVDDCFYIKSPVSYYCIRHQRYVDEHGYIAVGIHCQPEEFWQEISGRANRNQERDKYHPFLYFLDGDFFKPVSRIEAPDTDYKLRKEEY